MRARETLAPLATMLALVACGGDDEGLSAADCVERWDLESNSMRGQMGGLGTAEELATGRVWISPAPGRPDACLAVARFRGSPGFAMQENGEPGEFHDIDMPQSQIDRRLEEANATVNRDGTLELEE